MKGVQNIEMTLNEALNNIKIPDKNAMEKARKRWSRIAKPLGSLGILENAVIRISGMRGTSMPSLNKKAVLIFCADNGIVEEGVTQTDSSVTAVVSENFLKNETSVCVMAEKAGADIFPVDIGINREVHGLIDRKISFGTKNFLKEDAIPKDDVYKAIEIGIEMVGMLYEKGYDIICTGEMGIGNTTTSSAVLSVLSEMPPETVTGRGAGLTYQGLINKIEVIRKALIKRCPDKKNAVDVISKVGGLDIAGMTGAFIGGAVYGIPIVIDGFISAVSALCAYRICRGSLDFMLSSHISKENGMKYVFNELGLEPLIDCGMCLGEGTGAVASLPLYEMALAVYSRMRTFEDIEIEEYKPLE